MKRDREGTVKSLVRFFKEPVPKKYIEIAEGYYDWYYTQVEEYASVYPGIFKVFSTNSLNSNKGQREILDFAGFKNHTYKVGVKLNQGTGLGKTKHEEEEA